MKGNVAVGNVLVKTSVAPAERAAMAIADRNISDGDLYLRVLRSIEDSIKDDRANIAAMLERDGYYTLAKCVREL